jgi:hypothetical protein
MKQKAKYSGTAAYPFRRSGYWKILYVFSGIAAAAGLLAAPRWNQIYCMILSTAGFLGMIGINTVLGCRHCGKQYMVSRGFWRDALILLIWILLVVIWYSDLTGKIGLS